MNFVGHKISINGATYTGTSLVFNRTLMHTQRVKLYGSNSLADQNNDCDVNVRWILLYDWGHFFQMPLI